MKQELGTVIARRKYFSVGDKSRSAVLEVEIGIPARSPSADNEFMCSFRIRFGGSERTETVYGIDEMQVLQLALGYLQATLRGLENSSDLALSWAGEETGGLGIRIPNFSDPAPA
jgi:hypothetical protein